MIERYSRHPGLSRKQQVLKRCLIIALTFASVYAVAKGQTRQPSPSALLQTSTPVSSAKPVLTAIPLAEVVARAELVTATLRNVEIDLAADQTATIETGSLAFTPEIDARLKEESRAHSGNPSLETLKTLETGWQRVSNNLTSWGRDLTVSASRLDKKINDLTEQAATWELTLELAKRSVGTPPEVLQRIETVVAATLQTRGAVERLRAQMLALQARVVEQSARVSEALNSISQARDVAVNRLFVLDNPPIWGAEVLSRVGQYLEAEGQDSFSTQWTTFKAYAIRQSGRFLLHVVVILMIVAALYWMRRKVRPWVEEEPGIKGATLVFEQPLAAAVVLWILAGGWIYPQAPGLWRAGLGAIALVPAIIILRKLVEQYLFPILNALVVFYFVDLLRSVMASQWLTSRLLFLAEMLAGVLFLLWQIKSTRSAKAPEEEGNRFGQTVRIAARIALALFAAAFVANACGYVTLANLVGNAVLGSAYLAVILYVAARIAYGLAMFALRVRPLTLLSMVRDHRHLFRSRVRGLVKVLVVFAWFTITLDRLSLRDSVFEMISDALTAKLIVGSLNISLGNLLAFAVAVWVAFLLSRFIRFLLEEDVYPRLTLERGVSYAVSTVLNYAILLAGFLLAVAALGMDLTKFTILAGAFGVGLGFGLQNIFNNFVSGLIVLFERPVKVGDVIRTNEAEGVVKRIGIRASIISGWDGSDVIVPNGKLISDTVTNWTLLNCRRRIEIRVRAAYGTNPNQVIELLKGGARAHHLVAADPQPEVLLIEFGTDSLIFELRAWTNHFDQWPQIRSELAIAIAIHSAFVAENISMPYQQQDLHLKSIDPEALKAIAIRSSRLSNDGPLSDETMKASAPGGE